MFAEWAGWGEQRVGGSPRREHQRPARRRPRHAPYYSVDRKLRHRRTGDPSGMGVSAIIWGTWRDFEFVAPTDTQIARLVLWRDAYGQATAVRQGNWRLRAIADDDTPLGGSFGPDQCKTGEPYHPPTICRIGGGAYGDAAASRYDLAVRRLRLGLECFAPEVRSCDTGGNVTRRSATTGSRPRSSRSATRPSRHSTPPGPLFESGWRRADSDLAYTATDNTGIKNVRLLVDGQEHSRLDLTCDYTVPSAVPGRRQPPHRPRAARRSPTARARSRLVAEDAAGNVSSVDSHGHDRRARTRGRR